MAILMARRVVDVERQAELSLYCWLVVSNAMVMLVRVEMEARSTKRFALVPAAVEDSNLEK